MNPKDSEVDDPLRLYQTFQEAIAQWMDENSNRFVIPGMEYWPEGVDTHEEALEHYSEKAALDIVPEWEDRYYDE